MSPSAQLTRNAALGQPWSEVFLVGGGPSLLGFDFEKLRGRTVCAINDAVLRLPWASCLFSIDVTWIEQRAQVIGEFKGEKFFAAPYQEGGAWRECYLGRGRELGLSEDPAVINIGGNSGYGALNLAYLKGAQRIVLLGYDFRQSAEHWYPDYPWSRRSSQDMARDVMYSNWAKCFTTMRRQLMARGVVVLNASPRSAITVFPKVSLDDPLLWERN